MQFLSPSHLAPSKNRPDMYAPYFAGPLIDVSYFSKENSQTNWSMGTLDFLDACCWRAVVKPVGKENPEIQNTIGLSWLNQFSIKPQRSRKSLTHDDKGLREG